VVYYVQYCCFSGRHPSFDIVKQDTTFRDLALLPSSGKNPIVVGPIESLFQGLGLAPIGITRIGFFPEDGSRASSRNVVSCFGILTDG
jgi:hypothetical protein